MLDDRGRDPDDFIDPAVYIARLMAQPSTRRLNNQRYRDRYFLLILLSKLLFSLVRQEKSCYFVEAEMLVSTPLSEARRPRKRDSFVLKRTPNSILWLELRRRRRAPTLLQRRLRSSSAGFPSFSASSPSAAVLPPKLPSCPVRQCCTGL